MSSLWYEYLEESGGEVIASKYFSHVCRSLELLENNECPFKENEVKYARNHKDNLWWPIKVLESLSEGWLKISYVGFEEIIESIWWNTRIDDKTIKSIGWCIGQSVEWSSPVIGLDFTISDFISNATKPSTELPIHQMYSFERIKIGGYLECWLEQNVGLVWPVKVLANVGGRLRLSWFGCESAGKHGAAAIFVLFYLDQRLRGLGWARLHGWRYSAPENAGIVITISNADTFVRGSPGALSKELCNESEPEDHMLEEGWQIEAVDPMHPGTVRPAFVKRVFDRQYFLVELDGIEGTEPIRFPGYSGLASLMPANLSGVSGFGVRGLHDGQWYAHLMQAHPDRYAPHAGYFASVDPESDSAFLPGCKLEAVNPWRKDQIHAATVTRCMEGTRLVWVRLDSEPDLPDFLVDPVTSVDLFPVGWSEMMRHPLVLPSFEPLPHSLLLPFDSDEVTIYFHPQCFLGPFLSRSAATQILPRFIGPGLSLPVFKDLFHLLLKVSHKPHKLKRLLQLDNDDDCRDLMATIAIPSPKSEHSNRHRRNDWLVEVAVRRRAIPEFCRQTALSVGACPWFITMQSQYQCTLDCQARLSAKAGEKMSQQRRKKLFARPLTAVGLSYRTLKSRIVGGHSNSSSNSETGPGAGVAGDWSDDDEDQRAVDTATVTGAATNNKASIVTSASESCRVQTRGVRVPVSEIPTRRRCSRRRPAPIALLGRGGTDKSPLAELVPPFSGNEEPSGSAVDATDELVAEAPTADTPSLYSDHVDLSQYVIDPAFLAGDIARVTLTSNPIHWTADQVADYVSGTDCRQLASWLANERVDGAAFLLMTLPMLSTLCGLQLEPAIRLCKHVVSLKRAFVEQFADYKSLLPPDL